MIYFYKYCFGVLFPTIFMNILLLKNCILKIHDLNIFLYILFVCKN